MAECSLNGRRRSKDFVRTYDHKDFHRAITCANLNTEVPVGYANGRIFLEIELEPGQQWHTCCELILEHGQQVMAPASGHRAPEQLAEPLNDFDKWQARWQARCTGIATPNNDLERMYRQAVDDMGALCIYDMASRTRPGCLPQMCRGS